MRPNFRHLIQAPSKLLVFFEIAKSGLITLLVLAGSTIGAIGVFNSITTSEVIFEPLKVPEPFTDLGYSPEITTTQILDEVARINALSTSTKAVKSYGNKRPGEALASLHSLPGLNGLDIKEVQNIIQGLLGVKKERLSGEVTFTKSNDVTTYHVRIRQLPENKILVNFSTDAPIPEVINQISLKIVEKMDPAVAASYYRWSKDIDNSLRMVDEALRNDEDYDDNYALIGRAQIYIQKKKFDLAQRDIDRIFKNNPEFVPAINTQGYLYNETKEFDKALAFTKRAQKYWPNDWRPFNIAGDAYDGLGQGDEAEAAYIETIKRSPTWWSSYVEIAAFHLKRNRPDLAEESLHRGLMKFPENVTLLNQFAVLLLNEKRNEQAFNYLTKAHKIEPNNIEVWINILAMKEISNDPLITRITEKSLEKIKQGVTDTNIDRLKLMLGEP